jgi:hypothetical protein
MKTIHYSWVVVGVELLVFIKMLVELQEMV